MPKLIAQRPVLYLANQYKAGDALPQNNQEMVELWVKYGSAAYVDDDSNIETDSTKKSEKKIAKSTKGAQ